MQEVEISIQVLSVKPVVVPPCTPQAQEVGGATAVSGRLVHMQYMLTSWP